MEYGVGAFLLAASELLTIARDQVRALELIDQASADRWDHLR